MNSLIVTIVLTISLILAGYVFVKAIEAPPRSSAGERDTAFWAFKVGFGISMILWCTVALFLYAVGITK